MELAKVIRDLRGELEEAIVTGEGEALRFEVGEIELELSVEIDAGATVGAKARFVVAEVGARAGVDRTSTQRIRLTLIPRVGPQGAKTFISGPAERRER